MTTTSRRPVRRVSWPELLAHPEVHEESSRVGRVGFMAFHAGVESGTLEVAQAAAAQSGASLYTVRQPGSLRWHVPSTQVDPSESAVLASWLDHVEIVVAVHGYGRRDRPWDVLVGGADPVLAAEVAAGLRAALPRFSIVDDPGEIPPGLRGRHPDNPVNRARRGGVQVELPIRARLAAVVPAVADALAEVGRHWAASLGPRP